MTFEQKFAQIKKLLIKAQLDSIKENFAIQVNLTDDDCQGTFYIAFADGVFSVEPYDYRDNTAMVNVNSSDLTKIAERKLDPIKAVADGKLTVIGNIEHLNMLIDLMPVKKPLVRKTASTKGTGKAQKTEKKTTVKKSKAEKIEADTVKEAAKGQKPAAEVVKKEIKPEK